MSVRKSVMLMGIFACLLSALAGCNPAAAGGGSARDAAAAKADDILYVNLVWHQHQPLYYKDPQTGVYTRPWVRVHATKDYYDMAATVEKYPGVHATFNLTPVLLKQLEDFAAGAKDRYQELAEISAAALTAGEKAFIIERFFDANASHVIARFPRYAELLAKKNAAGSTEAAVAAFSEDDFRDLQVWFNLAWFDPDALAVPPLSALVAKGRGFAESDKALLFSEALRIIREVIPEHKKLQDKGQIEVITTPYAHPILPLLYSTALAAKGDPSAVLPDWYSFANDAVTQVNKSVQIYEKWFKRKPTGMWPAEGAVAPEIIKMVSDAGYRWMASGEQVLSRSLGIGDFTRDASDTVNEADAMYRPYIVQSKDGASIAMVFRDQRLSDLIGFEYSGTPGDQAAADLMRRLESIRARLKAGSARGPHMVSIILDGENAWENYDNDGKEFLNSLYKRLSESTTLRTTTVTEFMRMYPDQKKIDNLWWGAWFSPDYSTWIGEPEENTAWNYLAKVRKDLAEYDIYKRKSADPKALEKAQDFMLLAEGSDWFWWYGSDQDSGNDAYFDEGFRALLTGVYTSLGVPAPDFLRAPIIPEKPAAAAKPLDGPFTPRMDGKVSAKEWDKAAKYEVRGGAQARGADVLSAVYFGIDARSLYVRLDAKEPWSASAGTGSIARVYLQWDPQAASSPFTVNKGVLGFGCTAYIELGQSGGGWKASVFKLGAYGEWALIKELTSAASDGGILECGIPLELLGEASAGSAVRARVVYSEGARDIAFVPESGPLEIVLPLVAQAEPFLTVKDPAGDDNGPGTYTYPQDAVFKAGVFDILAFSVAETERDLILSFTLKSSIDNPWGSAIRLSLQTFDVYIDVDPGKATGSRMLLEGRNAALKKGDGWDYAVWVEGWNQKLISADASGKFSEVPGSAVKVAVDGPKGVVVISLPKNLIKASAGPKTWGYAAAVLSQDGYPAPGVRRVRDVQAAAEQWRIGGAPKAANATRIIDLAWNGIPSQAKILSTFTAVTAEKLGTASPDAFAQVPLKRK
jgi:alpha-amylase/alpha-mannosidase (GH57 family)